MTLSFLLDHHIPRAVEVGLRRRGINVMSAFADGSARLADPALLDRALTLNRVLVTFDDDLLVEATARQRDGRSFAGLVFTGSRKMTDGDFIENLVILAEASFDNELQARIVFLPL